jgi:Beta-glucosidase-related glycosidases
MRFIRHFSLLLAAAVLLVASCTQPKSSGLPLYLDESADIESRIDDALSRMTLEEKVNILHAQSKFSSAGVPRLGIPELWCSDGPHGIRAEVLWDEWNTANWTNDSCVAFPALTCLSATWNQDMSALYGKSIGEEARFREKDVLLGPGVNIYRTPLNGRNFEYMGEDPSLSAHMVVSYVQNVQKNGVAVCVKHFALNNEETFRNSTDVDLSDRALYEIYLPAFKASVCEGGAWSIMSSYNLFRGRHVGQDTILTKRILKDEWGFDGVVISDWGAVHDTDQAIESGLDLEFGTWTNGLTTGKSNAYAGYYLADAFLERLKDGRAAEAQLNEKARRVLRLMMRTSMRTDKPIGSLCSDEHYAAARKIAGEGIVLLKNENGVLPVGKDVHKILVVGENAIKPLTVGGGSSSLKVQREISPLQGIIERAGEDYEVVYSRGYVGSPGTAQDGLKTVDLTDGRSAAELIAEASSMAADADIVLFFGGLNKDWRQDCEGTDRVSLTLPYGQDAVISALAAANPALAVVMVSGNAVEMPWIAEVPAIVQGWYLGSEAGHALADVLFGDVTPSGKLPFTFPVRLEDSPAHAEGRTFPTNGANYYEEGIYVGYRWFESRDIKPLFAFGHGLSYTTFEYGQAKPERSAIKKDGSVKISVPVKNTGSVKGAEVVQLYVSDRECSVDRPKKELKTFAKVMLEPGETKTVTLTVKEEDLRFFDEQSHSWVSEAGDFDILIGSASDDIRSSVVLTLK